MKRNLTSKNYEQYRGEQISRSGKKWSSGSFDMVHFHAVLEEVMPWIKSCTDVCCMGIRGGEYNEGNELGEFRHRPEMHGAHFYGVDIHPNVLKVTGKTFCHDFNNLPEKGWTDRFDLIYSNSLDHAYDVSQTLAGWAKALRRGGFLLLGLSKSSEIGGSDIYEFEPADAAEICGDKFELVRVLNVQTPGEFHILLKKK